MNLDLQSAAAPPRLQLILIGNDPERARASEAAGVDVFMVDLELLGKSVRQHGRDTPVYGHTLGDIDIVRPHLSRTLLMVRLNPVHGGSREEVESVLGRGADLLMVPMVRELPELRILQDLVRERVPLVLLAETTQALTRLPLFISEGGPLHSVHLGLNDLGIGLGVDFLFEPLAGGLVDATASVVREAGCAFGFGGIGRMGHGPLPAEWILAEHRRVGSTMAILSRTFLEASASSDTFDTGSFVEAVRELRRKEATIASWAPEEFESNRQRVRSRVWTIAAAVRGERGEASLGPVSGAC